MGFMQGTLGFEMREILESKRISGFVAKQTRRLGVRKQSPTVQLWVSRALEFKLVEKEAEDDEVVIVGAML
eukprot:7146413-Karenia_brevis.AAC.1